MLSVGIRFLTGRYVATHVGDREEAEWPPHPDRLFMALADACLSSPAEEGEEAALRWLEAQGAPALAAPRAHRRAPVTVYVPVNDVSPPRAPKGGRPLELKALKEAAQLLPESRGRQPRSFPSCTPEDDRVWFLWPEATPTAEAREALARLCARLTRLGHSSSLVQAWLEEAPPDPTWVPASTGQGRLHLRIPGPGRLERLKASFEARRRPELATWQGYQPWEPARPPVAGSPFAPQLLVFRILDRTLPAAALLQATESLRGLVLATIQEDIPEWASGHAPGGGPSQRPHLACLGLTNVGHEHSDGRLMGLALAVPRDLDPASVTARLGPLLELDKRGRPPRARLVMGRAGAVTLELETRAWPPITLSDRAWVRPSHLWASVTPVVLDRFPKPRLETGPIAALLEKACLDQGLPRPLQISVLDAPLFRGAEPARQLPPYQRPGGRGVTPHVHCLLAFPEPVEGPVLLGAGRYRGYGLMRPLKETTP